MRSADIVPVLSALAVVLSAVWLAVKLRNMERDRFVAVTNTLFQIWQSPDFMRAQLWIVYELSETSWEEFLVHHQGREGQAALLRVTGFYNRLGTLVLLGMVDGRAILKTIGPTACAVWRKVEPLMAGARQENGNFLADFQRLVPHCVSVDQASE